MGQVFLGAMFDVTLPANPEGLTLQEAMVAGRTDLIVSADSDPLPQGSLPTWSAMHREEFTVPGNPDVQGGMFDCAGKVEFGMGGGRGFAVINRTAQELHHFIALLLAIGGD